MTDEPGEPAHSSLRLLGEVTWDGRPVTGDRTLALLAALTVAQGRAVPEPDLVEAVWGPDDRPAQPGRALQVVVSRTRTQTRRDVVVRVERGYRLAVPPVGVDASYVVGQVRSAVAAERAGDLRTARVHAAAARAVPVSPPGHQIPALEGLRANVRAEQDRAVAVQGRAASALGDHAEALALLATSREPDETTLVALLRSEAVVHGAPAALDRYERHRAALRLRLGVDPGPELQAVHRDLLAADSPVREGLRLESTELVGRADDVRALRALVGESRVVSVVGPGGLGKTRLAHVLGREAEQPVVHFVELVGVVAPEDVVGEVGSALGVRDSLAGRRVLSVEQRNDLRARIAQHLDRAPTLLILDNCEHVVEAVADLVAFLVASARGLRVVTTTRAPLAIAAERVFALPQLGENDAVELFCQRARSARPGVALAESAVRRVVTRLDGLPLAVELAAAKVRAMSVEDIDRRLDDRFALLRGGDRSAPDRHRTLLAVIDWSWNLLAEPERRALRRLSVFADGISLPAAEAVLGPQALDEVRCLVDQSLLSVLDVGGGARYRMLETVREFGRRQLVDAGEDAAARAAQAQWARSFASRASQDLWSPRQVDTMRALLAEENNLADVLRSAVAHADPETIVVVLVALSAFWTIRGEHGRVVVLAGAVDAALDGWEPAPDQVDAAVGAATLVLMNTAAGDLPQPAVLTGLIHRHADRVGDPRVRAMATVLAGIDPADTAGSTARIEALALSAHREGASLALMWSAHFRENAGDPEGALDAIRRALELCRREDGPWNAAQLRTMLASLYAQLGRHDEAAHHARLALPVLDLLGAHDDAMQVRAVLVLAALSVGDLGEAERCLAEVEAAEPRRSGLGGEAVVLSARAELALALGDVERGLDLYREAVARLLEISFPGSGPRTGLEPWALYGESTATAAFAQHGPRDGADGDGARLFVSLCAKAPRMLDPDRPLLDYPVAGLVLHGLGAWGLLRDALAPQDAVRLLVLADRFAYPRAAPTLSGRRTAEAAERRAPGLADRIRAEYGARRGPELLAEARAAVARWA